MRFTLSWHPDVERELAETWIRAPDRRAVTEAIARIEQMLTVSADTVGEEFYGDRLLVVAPLAVTYSVSVPDRMVQVLQVWHS